MIRYGAICCYYGKLPKYFPFWIESAGMNSNIDFYIVTDQGTISDYINDINKYSNIIILYISFSNLVLKIKHKLGFDIKINKPYKLCDFRLTYGMVFEDLLAKYDYFGWFDVDTILGSLNLLNNIKMSSYDVIGTRGHLTFLKNNNYMRKLFYNSSLNNEATYYKKVFKVNHACFFDEKFGLELLIKNLNVFTLNNEIADINPFKKSFTSSICEEPFIIIKNRKNGKLIAKNDNFEKEILYVHMQKRIITVDKNIDKNFYYIIPNMITSCKNFTVIDDVSLNTKQYDKLNRDVKIAKIINVFSMPHNLRSIIIRKIKKIFNFG